MRIQTNVILTIGIVLMVVLSGTAFNTFSFGASTNNTNSQSTSATNNTTKVSSQMMTTTTNPVVQNTTNSLIGNPYTTCTGTDDYLWNHVYNVKNGQPWGKDPGRLKITPDSQYKYGSCVTVTGQVYSIYTPPPPGKAGTHDEPDGDLHFTLALDQKYWGLSNPNDPECKPAPSHGLPNGCMNIIVEVICHKTPESSYYNGKYCDGVKPVYPATKFPTQGDKLKVSGKLVRDDGEGGNKPWNEIHPASYIYPLPK
jgi:hypothetical protein